MVRMQSMKTLQSQVGWTACTFASCFLNSCDRCQGCNTSQAPSLASVAAEFQNFSCMQQILPGNTTVGIGVEGDPQPCQHTKTPW